MRASFLTYLGILSILVCASVCLHVKATDAPLDQQLESLKNQQDEFEKRINNLIQNVTKVQDNLNKSDTTGEKVLILEKAIISERQQIYQIEKVLIPEFNISKCTCDQLTDEEKVHIMDELVAAKEQLEQLKMLAQTVPPCDALDQIKADLAKEQYFLNTMESVLYTECKVKAILSPTVFQSNIYAKNWILGPQTINDLIDEYYQRSVKYDHVTNCPLEKPFYNNKKCIACHSDTPVFNMFERKCTICQGDYEVDNDLKKCVPVIHNTDFVTNKNWALDGAISLPEQAVNSKPCAQVNPYYDGEHCQACHLPQYWSVKQNACVSCKQGLLFDVNTQGCVQPLHQKLSILENTDWVTNDGNITRVLSERIKVLEKNKTSKDYTYCEPDIPFYDGIQCVSCPKQYNIDSRVCSKASEGKIYNENTREYIKVDVNRQSDFSAGAKFIQEANSQHKDNEQIQNCPKNRPWFNGDGCVACLYPFDIFDVDARQCMACDSEKIYNSSTNHCQDRQRIYVNNNLKRIMATEKMSVDQYKTKTRQLIEANPEALILECPNPEDQSNYQKCFSCPHDSYLNIETLACDFCDGRIDKTTKKCLYKAYLFTNLNAKNLVNFDVNKEQQQARIDGFIKEHPNAKICPIETPYSNNQTCIVCDDPLNPIFDYNALKCTHCEGLTMYINTSQSCQPFAYLTNLDSDNIVLGEGQTLESLKSEQDKQKGAGNTQICPKDKPYTNNGAQCFTCEAPNSLFNANTKSCYSCQEGRIFDVKKNTCQQIFYLMSPKAENFIASQKNGLAELKSEQERIRKQQFFDVCPESKPYSAGTTCVACDSQNPHFSLQKKACIACPDGESYIKQILGCMEVYYLTRLDSKNLLEVGNSTVKQVEKQQAQLKKKKITAVCPKETPYSQQKRCISCNDKQNPYFSLAQKKCVACPNTETYIKQLKQCRFVYKLTRLDAKNLLQDGDATIDRVQQQQAQLKQDGLTQICPEETPYSSQNKCIACKDDNPYFNLAQQECSQCQQQTGYFAAERKCKDIVNVINTDALSNGTTNNYIETPNKNLEATVKDNEQAKSTNPVSVCPNDKPFSDGSFCLACDDSDLPYFNLETKQCETCAKHQIFDSENHMCRGTNPYTNLKAIKNYIEEGDGNVAKIAQNIKAVKNNVTYYKCPAQKPYSDGKKCLQPCRADSQKPYFNLNTNQCQGCPADYRYNAKQHICKPIIPRYANLANNRWIINDGQPQKVVDQTVQLKKVEGAVICEPDYPFYNDKQRDCFACSQQGDYWNYDNDQCQKCESKVFDINWHQCLTQVEPDTAQTSLQAEKLIFGGISESQNNETYQQNLKKYQKIKDCPKSEPYFDGVACIKCPQNYSYFNIKSRLCMTCPQDSKYNEEFHECMNQNHVVENSPNPQKMYANIF